ncbi:MAG: VOC family protein [Anaerolineae bacterium]|nr:VOC family protein [Anaerolineae bacterium]
MKITGLDHFQIAMPAGGEAEARHFYGRLLGMAEVDKPDPLASRGGCWFEGPGFGLHLGVQEAFVPAHKGHPAFLVGDVLTAARTLRAARVAVEFDHTLPQVRRFYASDPFGNRLEFIQGGDGFSQQNITN